MSCALHRPFDVPAADARALASFDPYASRHHRLRLDLSGLVVRLGCADPADAHSVSSLLADLRRQLGRCLDHLRREEATHAALRDLAPEAVEELEHFHALQRQGLEALEALIAKAEASGSLRALNLTFTRYVAAAFAHMAHVELETLPILQALFTDAELMALSAPPVRRAA